MPDMLLSKYLLSHHSPYYFSYYIFVLELLRRKHLSFFPVWERRPKIMMIDWTNFQPD